jgi:putative nucleotidyltransferase with HDIG domain
MRSALRSSFLRTRFGRRMLLLFLACAMLPLAVLTIIVLREASSELHRQSRVQLQRTAKATGMAIIAQVHELTELSDRMAHAAVSPDRQLWREVLSEPERRLRAVAVRDDAPGGKVLSAWHSDAFAALAQQLTRDAARTVLFPMQQDGTRVMALSSTHPVAERRLRVEALIDMNEFFGETEVQGWRDSGVEACVLLASEPLWCSLPRTQWSMMHAAENLVTVDGAAYSAATWSGFAPLTRESSLRVVSFSDTRGTLGGSATFRRSIVLLVLCSLVLVFLASHVQLRRSLRPLEELAQATHHVGLRNHIVTVSASTDDEFGTLARSFNTMSSRITSHMALLSSSAAINDEALRAANLKELLPRLTAHVRSLLPENYGVSLALRLEQTLWLRRSVMTRSQEWFDDELELGMAGLAGLLHADLTSGRFAVPDARPYLRAPSQDLRWRGQAAVIPLRAENELVGILTVLVPDGTLVTNAVLDNMRAIAGELALAANRTRLVGRLEQFNYGTLTALARTVDAKSPWTAGHSESVTHTAMRIAEHLRLTSDELDIVHRGGLLHDIGKIAVPGTILDKPARLTPEEMTIVQSHPDVGARILAPIEAYTPILPVVLYHHERFDGKGYPRGLCGNAIPTLARLVAVADVYDALVSDRPYREGWAPERALAHILDSAGTHFDPVMADAFAAVEPLLRKWYADRRAEENERRGSAPHSTELATV